MGTKKTLAILSTFALLVLSACGHKDDPTVQANGTTASDNSSFVGGRCGDQVVRDYQRLNGLCRFPRDREEGFRCRQAAEDFLHRYPAVSCTVSVRGGRGEVRERRIEAREIEQLVERARRSGF